jgi:hypothetical protein
MHKKMRTLLAATAAVALAATAFAAPAAAGNKKGTTFVAPSELTGTVLQGVLKPGKLVEGKGAAFRIVGNPKKGPIKHVGGLVVDGSAGILEDDDLKLRNFRIKVGKGVVVGNVEGFGKAKLFTFDPKDAKDDLQATLFFTETASLAIVGDDSIKGLEAGVATIDLK